MLEIENLRNSLDNIFTEYCSDIVKAKNCFTGSAFFPGGNGIYKPELNKTFPKGKIMVLGQDFGTEEYIENAIKIYGKPNNEENSPTWNNLISIFAQAGIDPRDCFFTNAIMGVRKAGKMTGRSAAFNKNNDLFLGKCHAFFLKQIEIQQPKLIIALGYHVYRFLHTYFPKKPLASSLIKLDEQEIYVIENVQFAEGISSNVIFLTHPSFFNVNIAKRKYKGFVDSREGSNLYLKMAVQKSFKCE